MLPAPPTATPVAPAAADAVERVLTDSRHAILRLTRAIMAGVGVPLNAIDVALTLADGRAVTAWQGLVCASVVITPALLWLLPASRAALAGAVLVGGLGTAAIAAIFHGGPGIGVGIVFCGWAIAAVFYTGGIVVPTLVAAVMVGTLWLGDTTVPLGFPWATGGSHASWALSMLIVVGATVGVTGAFRSTLDRLRRAVADEATARHAAAQAQREREDALTAAAQALRLEALGRLAGGVAHDFNNAIAIIALGLDELREPLSPAEREQVLGDMARATRGAEATSRQLLAFARQGTAAGGRADPEAVVRGMARALKRLLPESVHVLVHAVPVGAVDMAAGDLEQVLLNLCLNARDAMPDGGTLALHVRREHDEVVLEVTDSGTGMSAEVQARALDPFFTTKAPGHGTGLGLAMVAASLARVGGRLEIDSTPGAGTTIRLRLPRAAHAEAPAPDPGPAAGGAPRSHVLVLEDDAHLHRLLTRSLERGGHAVTVAGTVGDALMALQGLRHVDLLLTDAVLPDGTPGRLIRAYRERHPDGPVLVCSGYVPAPDLIAGVDAASYAFLQKPFDARQLAAAIAPLLDRRAAAA